MIDSLGSTRTSKFESVLVLISASALSHLRARALLPTQMKSDMDFWLTTLTLCAVNLKVSVVTIAERPERQGATLKREVTPVFTPRHF